MTWDYRPGTFTPLTQSESTSSGDAPQSVVDERFYAIVADQVGMPAELIAADGTVAGYQQHTLWGGTLWRPGGAATPLRFPGQYHDPETGLHYNQQRYYDPVTGSYLTPDPLGLAPAPNPHAYVPNPLIQIDPLGLMSCAARKSGIRKTLVVRGGISILNAYAHASGATFDETGKIESFCQRCQEGGGRPCRGDPKQADRRRGYGQYPRRRWLDTGGIRGGEPPYHCLVGGCTPEQFSELFAPTIKNPWKWTSST